MSNSYSRDQSPTFTVLDEGGRAKIAKSVESNKFKVGDKVYLIIPGDGSRRGPYFIASVLSPRKYALSLENGEAVTNGDAVEEEQLERA